MTIKKGKHSLHERDHVAQHETDFRVIARRNKLLGLWAAAKLDLPQEQHESYARQIVSADLDEPGDEDVIRKVLADFAQHNAAITREEVIEQLDRLVHEARSQVLGV